MLSEDVRNLNTNQHQIKRNAVSFLLAGTKLCIADCNYRENRNKRSHNTGNRMAQAFNNWRSGRVKGSHNRPYVTLPNACRQAIKALTSEILQGKVKSKATDTLQGQSVNGVLAGDKDSNLPGSNNNIRVSQEAILKKTHK